MGGKTSRSKGSRGELEIFQMLSDELGFVVTRNLVQTRNGGADTVDIPGWAIEVKRQEKLNLNAWWSQTTEQAGLDNPILFYRQSRQPWRAMVWLHAINIDYAGMPYTAIIEFEAACMIIRESMNYVEIDDGDAGKIRINYK